MVADKLGYNTQSRSFIGVIQEILAEKYLGTYFSKKKKMTFFLIIKSIVPYTLKIIDKHFTNFDHVEDLSGVIQGKRTHRGKSPNCY